MNEISSRQRARSHYPKDFASSSTVHFNVLTLFRHCTTGLFYPTEMAFAGRQGGWSLFRGRFIR